MISFFKNYSLIFLFILQKFSFSMENAKYIEQTINYQEKFEKFLKTQLISEFNELPQNEKEGHEIKKEVNSILDKFEELIVKENNLYGLEAQLKNNNIIIEQNKKQFEILKSKI